MMLTKEKRILLLDSSPIIRNKSFDVRKLTSKNKRKHPEYFESLVQSAKDISEKSYSYYYHLNKLVENNTIYACITYNAIFPNSLNLNKNIIPLFGVMTIDSDNSNHSGNSFDGILFGEKVNQELYFKTIDFFFSADTIILDPSFLSLNIGYSYLNYISSDTQIKVLRSFTHSIGLPEGLRVVAIDYSPEEFVEQLCVFQ